MNNTKTALPVGDAEDDNPAALYLLRVREEAAAMENIFVSGTDVTRPVSEPSANQCVFAPNTPPPVSVVQARCGFEVPVCTDHVLFWKQAAPLVAALEATDPDQNGKEAWKSYLSSVRPHKLSHEHVFYAANILAKMPISEHLAGWAWCLLLQVPTLLTSSELAVLRNYARVHNDGFYCKVLAACFGQADLRGEEERKQHESGYSKTQLKRSRPQLEPELNY